jgi:hypothetical protein
MKKILPVFLSVLCLTFATHALSPYQVGAFNGDLRSIRCFGETSTGSGTFSILVLEDHSTHFALYDENGRTMASWYGRVGRSGSFNSTDDNGNRVHGRISRGGRISGAWRTVEGCRGKLKGQRSDF